MPRNTWAMSCICSFGSFTARYHATGAFWPIAEAQAQLAAAHLSGRYELPKQFVIEQRARPILKRKAMNPALYGLAIRQELAERPGRAVSHGAAYVTLERLAKQGLVETWMGDPTPRRGGRSKRNFSVTPAGIEALRESQQAMQSLRRGLEGILEQS